MKLSRTYFLLAGIMLLAAALRFFEIDRLPLWFDERKTLQFASSGFSYIWTELPKHELSPPLYYSLLKLWLAFGHSESALRSLSALFGIATVPLVYAAGRLVVTRPYRQWSGTAAALLFACSPRHILYAQEARPYTILTFSLALSLLGILWLMRHPDLARIPRFGFTSQSPPGETHRVSRRAALAWLALISGLTLCLWLHNAGPLYVAAMVFSTAVWWAGNREDRSGLGWNLILGGAAVFCLWIPNLPLLWYQLPHTDSMDYIKMPNTIAVAKVFKFLFSLQYAQSLNPFDNLWSIQSAINFLTGCMAVRGIWTIGRHRGANVALLLLSISFGPILLALLASYLYHPIFLARIFIASSVPFFLALGACLSVLLHRSWRVLILALCIAISLHGVWRYYQIHEKPRVIIKQDIDLKP